MIRTCDNQTPCLGDEPLDNFSSEADDSLDYFSTRYSGTPPPPLLHNWDATECGVTVVSAISQLDADLKAAAQAALCVDQHREPTIETFTNSPQTCCVPCPDGSQSCYTLPGGLIVGINQASADSLAHQIACTLVIGNRVCVSNIPACTCVGKAYSATLTATQPVQWGIVGFLPPGLVFSGGFGQTATISGVPTTNGQYTFQITAHSQVGTTNVKTITISVLEITTTQLPAFSIGVPYSFQLVAAGGSGNYQWKIAAGSLPNGLVLDNDGLIHGTPT